MTVDGVPITRPGRLVATDSRLDVTDPAAGYVSRGAVKLLAGLDHFGYCPAGRHAIDLGASTGGFTQVLLERGATSVCAVDVGRDQMDAALAGDPRVILLEGVNVRDLTSATLGGRRADALACDISFMSLRIALPPALGLLAPGSWIIALVKPQFEIGTEALNKSGVVRDRVAAHACARSITEWMGAMPGFDVDGMIDSPLSGGDGNREFLLGARKS